MKENEQNNIEQLLNLEKNYRESGQYLECFKICQNILKEIELAPHTYKFEIVSNIFLYPDQTNYVRIFIMHELFQNTNYINSISIKKKYYKLLIDSFNKTKSIDFLAEKTQIVKLYNKNNSENFDELDK